MQPLHPSHFMNCCAHPAFHFYSTANATTLGWALKMLPLPHSFGSVNPRGWTQHSACQISKTSWPASTPSQQLEHCKPKSTVEAAKCSVPSVLVAGLARPNTHKKFHCGLNRCAIFEPFRDHSSMYQCGHDSK